MQEEKISAGEVDKSGWGRRIEGEIQGAGENKRGNKGHSKVFPLDAVSNRNVIHRDCNT